MRNKQMYEIVSETGIPFPYWDYLDGSQSFLVEMDKNDFCLRSNWEKGLYRFYELFGHLSV